MAIAKVILNGDTLMDVTSNTVTSETLKEGYTATGNDGSSITGTFIDNLQEFIEGKPAGLKVRFNSSDPVMTVLSKVNNVAAGRYWDINFIYNRSISLLSASAIGSYAFNGCAWLTSVLAPLCTTIGESAFAQCKDLEYISFPLCSTIYAYAFYQCNELQSANFSLCTTIRQSVFAYCSNLSTADLPICNAIWQQAFYSCNTLQSISFPQCTSIGQSAFQQCSSLSIAYLPMCSIISDYAFYQCINLQQIILSSTYSQVAPHTFESCSALSSFNFENIQRIQTYAFNRCDFRSLVFSNILSTSFLAAYTFASNYNLSYAVLNNTLSTGSISIYQTFVNCSRLLSLYLLGNVSYYNGYNSNFLEGTPISNLTEYTDGIYGSIYVPASWYSTYISQRGWSQYASRIVSLTEAEIEALNFY